MRNRIIDTQSLLIHNNTMTLTFKIIFIISLWVYMSCSTSPYTMPISKIDDPLIQPEKLYRVSAGKGADLTSEETGTIPLNSYTGGLIISSSSSFDFDLINFDLTFHLGENDYAKGGATREGQLYSVFIAGYNPLKALSGLSSTGEPLHNFRLGFRHKIKVNRIFNTSSFISRTYAAKECTLSVLEITLSQGYQVMPRLSLEGGVSFIPVWIYSNSDSQLKSFIKLEHIITLSLFQNLRVEMDTVILPGSQFLPEEFDGNRESLIVRRNHFYSKIQVLYYF